MNFENIPIFCINLRKREDRKNFVLKRAKEVGIAAINFVEAVEGADEKQISKYASELHVETGPDLSPGEKGCLLSHAFIWKTISSNKIPLALVLEDDVCFLESFVSNMSTILKIASELPSIGMIFCGHVDTSTANLQAINSVQIKRLRSAAPTHCYLVSMEAAQLLFSEMQAGTIELAVDHYIFTKYDKLAIWKTSKSLCHQNYQLPSDIQSPEWTKFKLQTYLKDGFPQEF